jgi:hypothetical protein
MSLHLAVDVDGCLYDFESAFWESALADQHGTFTPQQRDEMKQIPAGELAQIWDFWQRVDIGWRETTEFIERTASVFDRPQHTIFRGVSACKDLMDEGNRVDLLTSPWQSIEFQFRTRRTAWALDAFNGRPPHGILFTRPNESKNDFMFDVIVEDRADTAVDVANDYRHAVLLATPYNDPDGLEAHLWDPLNEDSREYVHRVNGWDEALEVIRELKLKKEAGEL